MASVARRAHGAPIGRPTAGNRPRPRASARRVFGSAVRAIASITLGLAVLGTCAAVEGPFGLAAPARGASPSPGIVTGGDTRSEGEGAGLVGSPIVVALGVIAIGTLAWGGTLLFVRLRRPD